MNQHYRSRRKIDPARGATPGDGSPDDGGRVEAGPTALPRAERFAAGLRGPDLAAMRAFRHRRPTAHVAARGLDALATFDIRYATDATAMQIRNAHDPFRACRLCADGPMVLRDRRNATVPTASDSLVAGERTGADFLCFNRGDRADEAAGSFAAEVESILAALRGGPTDRGSQDHDARPARDGGAGRGRPGGRGGGGEGPRREGPRGGRRHALRRPRGEAAVAAMEALARAEVPRCGVAEGDVRAVLHPASIRRGGEWIETRLLASGPRTNTWFRGRGPREVRAGKIVAFGTDLIGAYGICCDMSRTWWIGPGAARPDPVGAMRHVREDTARNMALLRPGVTISELSAACHPRAPSSGHGSTAV